jgi:ABC-type multidrug transport system fused ATPase/permease subunit
VAKEWLGVVSQQPQLFESASIEENILYGVPPWQAFTNAAHKEQAVRRAARLANVDWLDGVEGGFKSTLGSFWWTGTEESHIRWR